MIVAHHGVVLMDSGLIFVSFELARWCVGIAYLGEVAG